MLAPPLPHTPSNSHFVRRVKLRLAYRPAFVIYIYIYISHQISVIFMIRYILYLLFDMNAKDYIINYFIYNYLYYVIINYTYIYSKYAVYIFIHVYIRECTVLYCNCWIKKGPIMSQLHSGLETVPPCSAHVLINAVAIEAHREHRSLRSLSSNASADWTWKKRGNKSCCQAMTPNTSASWGP